MELAETAKISRSTQKNLNTNAVNHRNQESAIQVRQQLYYRDDAGVFFELNPPPEAVFRPHWVTEAPDASISAENGCHDYEASSPHWTKKNIVLRMQQVSEQTLDKYNSIQLFTIASEFVSPLDKSLRASIIISETIMTVTADSGAIRIVARDQVPDSL